jgi:hypothetical protein
MLRLMTLFLTLMLSCLMLLTLAWGAGALWFKLPLPSFFRMVLIIGWSCVLLTAIVLTWRHAAKLGTLIWLIALILLLIWWSTIKPSNDRAWADDVAHQLNGVVQGDVVTLHNVRNFAWRSDTDYVQGWETRQYDLNTLTSVDVALSYWMGPAIAHTLVSFGFDDGRHITFSVEIRKKQGEAFSAIGGFFKQFEESIVAADERDILAVRTNVLDEDVYLYRVNMPQQAMRSLFISYVDAANDLVNQARFYNTITANCTTIVFDMITRIIPGLPLDWRLIASGYLPNYLYSIGALNMQQPLPTLTARGRITDKAQQVKPDEDFSAKIRQDMP